MKSENSLIIGLNLLGVIVAYGLMAISLYIMTEINLSTKGFWGVSILLLTVCLINFVKYWFEARQNEDRIRLLEEAKNERLLAEFVTDSKKG
jgi:hypothetical protein